MDGRTDGRDEYENGKHNVGGIQEEDAKIF